MTRGSTKRRHKRTGDDAPYSDAALPWNHRAEKEIQRLRTAMVHAMDDAATGARAPTSWDARRALEVIAKNLKTALEKK